MQKVVGCKAISERASSAVTFRGTRDYHADCKPNPGIEPRARERQAIPNSLDSCLMKFNPWRASSSPDGAKSRQIDAAEASSGSGSAKDSIVIQPSSSTSRSTD